jgi:hypothetical protein
MATRVRKFHSRVAKRVGEGLGLGLGLGLLWGGLGTLEVWVGLYARHGTLRSTVQVLTVLLGPPPHARRGRVSGFFLFFAWTLISAPVPTNQDRDRSGVLRQGHRACFQLAPLSSFWFSSFSLFIFCSSFPNREPGLEAVPKGWPACVWSDPRVFFASRVSWVFVFAG